MINIQTLSIWGLILLIDKSIGWGLNIIVHGRGQTYA